MLESILQIILMLALVVAILLTARAIPRVEDDEDGKSFEEWLKSLPVDRVDDYLKKIYYKLLRKLKIALLKFDNNITRYLERTRKEEKKERINQEDLEKLQSFSEGDSANKKSSKKK